MIPESKIEKHMKAKKAFITFIIVLCILLMAMAGCNNSVPIYQDNYDSTGNMVLKVNPYTLKIEGTSEQPLYILMDGQRIVDTITAKQDAYLDSLIINDNQ